MAGRVKLDPQWWKKNCPEGLGNSAVQQALSDFAKVSRGIERSNDFSQFFKSVGKLKSAIAKDAQALRKAKNKEGVKLLEELEQLAHSKAQVKQRQLTLTSDIKASGLSNVAGGRVSEVSTASGSGLTDFVNGGDRKWKLVSGNKPFSGAKSKSCQAIPKSLSTRDLSGWQSEGFNWSCEARNKSNTASVSLRLRLQYRCGGHLSDGGGAFLDGCQLWVTDLRVLSGYSVEASCEAGKPYNSGSKTAPVGALPLTVSFQITSPLDKISRSWVIHCHGNKKRELK